MVARPRPTPRFAIARELGHGGEGRVVLVRDAARGGAEVALKETHDADGGGLAREFALLATLRHRHLAEVYDFFRTSPLIGLAESRGERAATRAAPTAGGGRGAGVRAAYTQAYVPGDDLYRTLRDDPALWAEVVAQLVRALAQLHAAGLAHLDLKPDNVLVERGAGGVRARLVDFGIAARLGSRPEVVRGSRSYVAPEVLAGEAVTPSADLFSLGIALGEIALGSPGAARELAAEPWETRRARLVAAGMRDAHAAWAAGLIALDRDARPASAHEAARAWGRLTREELALVTAASATGLVRSGGLVGREAERRRVLEAVAARTVVTIGGPASSGRRALVESALHEAALAGACVEAWPLAEACAGSEGFVAALGRLVEGAEALTLTPEAGATGAADPEAYAAALGRAAKHAVATLAGLPAGRGGAALFVPDAAAAPAPVRAFFEAAREAGRPLPLGLVLGGWGEASAEIALGPVGVEAVRGFVASRFGEEVAREGALVSALASASGGLMGHLEALCELLVAERALILGEGGWRLGRAVEELGAALTAAGSGAASARRVALLAEAERRVLGVVAALTVPGRGVSPAIAALALADELGEAVIDLAVDDLVAYGLLRRDARGAVALGHAGLAAVVPAVAIEGAARARVLGAVGLAGEVRARLEGGEVGARRALGLVRAELAAARPEAAERAAELALALAPVGSATRLEALWARAEVADRLGPRRTQIEALRGLAAELPDGDARRLEVEARLFWALTRVADASCEREGEALVARARAAERPFIAAEVAVHLAIVASQRGEQDRAERWLVGAREGLDEGPETLALRARISNNLGNVYAYRGEAARALEAYREARRLKVEEGDPVGERIALGNMALMALELGEPGRAWEDLARSLALARRTGHRRGEAWSLLTLAELGLQGGAATYARRRAEAARELARGLGDKLVEGDATTTLAEALFELGQGELARAEAAAGEALAEAADNAWTARRARAIGAMARLAAGEADALGELEALAGDGRADAVTRMMAGRSAAEARLARGEVAAAAAVLAKAEGEGARAHGGPRGGVRRAAFLRTRARVHGATGVAGVTGASGASAAGVAHGENDGGERAWIEAWVAAWPEEARPDGVDEAALSDGPCRRAVRGHAAVAALLAGGRSADSGAVGSRPSVNRGRSEEGARLGEELDGLAGAGAAALGARLCEAVTALVRGLGAERAFVVAVEGGAGGADEAEARPAAVRVLEARDADGEAIGEAIKRIPEAALEAARRGAAWRASGADGRGAIAVVPWAVPVGAEESAGAVVLQNRFVAEAFADLTAVGGAVEGVRLVLRLVILERALAEARERAQAARQEARAVEQRTTEEIRTLRRELESTREQLGPAREYPEIVFASAAMKKMLRQVDRVVATDLPVHVHGESGTGKELVARAIHQLGARAKGPFVPQNCTAIPPTLFESELFGHERGAFTGAMRSSEGLFRRAHGGTLFLDEIGDLPLELQAKLLRVLETGEVRPVGATRSVSVDVRIVSATHRDLSELIKRGTFREDLYYRLNVIRIDVPALRERAEDIPVLVKHFLAVRARQGEAPAAVDEAAMKALVRYAWPGNVRQLENEIARASLLAEGGVIGIADLSPEVASARASSREAGATGGAGVAGLAALGLGQGPLKERVDRLEALVLEETLRNADNNKSEVARVLGLSRAGLNLKLKRLGLWDAGE